MKSVHNAQIKEGKIPLIVGSVDAIFFLIITIVSMVDCLRNGDTSTALFCFFIFGAFVLLGVALIMTYYFRRIYISEDECFVSKWYGRKVYFKMSDIESCQLYTMNMQTSYRLYNTEGNVIARFEGNMQGVSDVLCYLKEHHIRIKERETLSHFEKLVQPRIEEEIEQEAFIIHERFYSKKIVRIRKILRVVSFCNLALQVLVYVTFSYRVIMMTMVCSMLFWYIMYLVMYPSMVLEYNIKDKEKWRSMHIELPLFPLIASLLFLMLSSSLINIQDYGYFAMLVVLFTVLLYIPFIIISKKHDETIRKRKWISVFCSLLLLSTTSMPTLNWTLRVGQPIHEQASVVDKKVSHSRSGNSYYITVLSLDGREHSLEVASSLYKQVNKKSVVEICKRTSVFQLEYWYVHL